MSSSIAGRTPRRVSVIFAGMLVLYTIFLQWLSLLAILLFPAILLTGAVGAIWSGFDTFRTRSWASFHGVVIVFCAATIWFVLPTNYIGAYIRARAESNGYEETIRQAQAGEAVSCDDRLYSCMVDEGPPVRVAFVWGGILDNWVGAIYDPHHVILDAKRYEKLFGGDMLGCERLWDSYYFCGFT